MVKQIWALTIYNGDTFDAESGRIFYDEDILAVSASQEKITLELVKYIPMYPKTPRVLDDELTPTKRLDIEPGTLIVHTLNTV